MRIFALLLFCLSLSFLSMAQSTVAKIKYEQAEEAFNKADYRLTLTRLGEVQKILGEVNPRIMYLRIMAQRSLVEKGNYSYGMLDSLRKDIEFYVRSYETNTAVEDKFREVYLLGEELAKYPASKAEYDKVSASWKEEEQKKQAEEAKEKAFRNRGRNFLDSLVKQYSFLPCATVEEFKKYNKQVASTVTKLYTSGYYGRPYVPFSNMFKEGPLNFHVTQHPAGLLVDTFSVVVDEVKKNEKKQKMQQWIDLIYANFPAASIQYDQNNYKTITVKESEDIPFGIRVSLWELTRDFIELSFIHGCENDPRNKKSP